MVTLDDGALAAQTGLHHVGIDGALGKEVHSADLLGLLLKHADEFLADDLALALRLGDAGQLGQKARAGVDTANVHVELVLHHLLHLIALVLAQQAVIHEDAGQLIAHGALQQGSGHGAVHAAGQGQQHAAVADLTAALGHRLLHIGGHGPLGAEAADGVQEILQDLGAVFGMQHLGMELHAVELLVGALHRCVKAALGGADDLEAGRQALHLDAVAHPVDGLLRHIVKQRRFLVGQFHLAVFAGLCLAALAAQQVHHQLLAIADAQHGDAHLEQCLVHHGGVGLEHGGGAAGKDQGVGCEGADLLQGHAEGFDLAVHAALADAACHQQVILAAEVQNQNFLHLSHPPGR